MSNPTRRHHRIPRFYLNGFTDATDAERVWVYRRRGIDGEIAQVPREPILQRTEKVCWEYDKFATVLPSGEIDHDSVEEELRRQENLANPILKLLREGEQPTVSHKQVLASYISMLYRRGRSQERARGESAQISAQENVSLERLAWAAMSGDADLSKAADVFRNAEKYLRQIRQNVLSVGVTLQLGNVEAALLEIKWQFLRPPTSDFFITTDSPVYLNRLGQPDGHVLFPISSELLLFAARTNEGEDLTFGSVDGDHTYVFNMFVMRQAWGEIYARECADWIRSCLQMLAEEAWRAG